MNCLCSPLGKTALGNRGRRIAVGWWELFVESPGEDSPGKQREADSSGPVGTVCGVPWGRQPWETEGGG